MASSGKWEARMGIVLDTSGISSEIQKVQKVVSQKSIAIKVGSETGTKQLTTFKNALGGVTKEVKTFNSAGEEMASGIKSYSTKAQEATKVNNNLGQSFLDVTLKVAKFYASTLIIKAFTATVSEASQIIKEFDDAITDFKKVSDLSGDSLDNYTQKLGELGEEVARTRIEMTQNATIMKQAGYSDEDAAQLAKLAAMYQNVADAEISASEAGSFLVSQMKAYNLSADEAETILDQLNEVSNNYAVSSSDIATGLTKSASALANLGNTSAQTIGLLTAGTEQLTGQASKVGKGLQSIGINLANMAKESKTLKINVGDSTKEIDLYNKTTGDMLSTFDILKQISKYWGDMTNAQKTAIASAQAGKTRFDVYSAVMNQFSDAISASETALNSQGSASEENAKYMDSLSAKISEAKGQFQELVLGNGGLESFAKVLLSAANGILSFINTIGGLPTILTAISTILIVKLLPSITKLATNIATKAVSSFNSLITSIKDFKNISLSATSVVGALGTALTLYMAISNAVEQSQEELAQKALDAGSKIEDEEKSLEDLLKDYSEISTADKRDTKSTEELESLNKKIVSAIGDQAKGIDVVNGKIDEQNKKVLEGIKAKLKEDEASLKTAASVAKSEMEDAFDLKSFLGVQTDDFSGVVASTVRSILPSGTDLSTFNAPLEALEDMDISKQISSMQNWISLLEKAKEKADSNGESTTKYDDAITFLGGKLETVSSAQNSYNSKADAYKKNTEEQEMLNEKLGGSISDVASYEEKADEITSKYSDNQELQLELLEYLSNLYPEYNNSIKSNTETVETASQINKEYKKSMDGIDKTIDSIQSAYGTLNGAVEEYNKNGGFSMDTVQSLLDLSPSYLKMLDFENGKVTLNSKALEKKTQAQVKQMKQTIRNTAISKLNALAEQTSETATYDNGAIHINSASDWKKYHEQVTATTKALTVNQAVKNAESKGVDKKKINKVISDMKKQISIVDNLTSGVKSLDNASTKNTKSTKNNTKATNSNTVAKSKAQKQAEKLVKTQEKLIERLNDEKDVLNEQKSNYEKVFDYIKSEIEDQIEKYENLRDTKDNLIDEELDLEEERHEGVLSNLEEEKESLEDYWDAQIDEYEKANDELEEQIELQKLQEALGEAKSTKVKVLGESGKFEYREDEEAVSKAQYDIDEYNRKKAYEEKLQALKDEKEKEISIIESSIEKENNLYEERKSILEKEKEENDEYYNNKIEKLKSYESEISSYETLIDDMESKSLAKKLLGTDLENQNWNKRIANLTKFVNNYNEILASLSSVESATSTAKSKKEKAQEIVDKEEAKAKAKKSSSKKKSTTKKKKTTAKKHASGIISVPDDEVAIVGENPNYQELSIGSKLNSDSGIVTSLNRGTGIIPHNLTSTLVDMARMYQGGNEATPIANTNSKQANYTIQNMTVQADNADEFVKSITTKFKNMAIQTAY